MSDTGLDVAAGPAPVPPKPSQDRWLSRLLRERSVRVAAVGWVAANALVVAVGSGGLPFDWPTLPGRAASERLVETNLALLEVFALMGVVYLLTRRRAAPDLAARAPRRVVARRETVALLAYGVLGLIGGFFLARSFGWHPFRAPSGRDPVWDASARRASRGGGVGGLQPHRVRGRAADLLPAPLLGDGAEPHLH